ncbi:uncharacterized protein TRIADDRAFT_55093 [Trichoplax adhaerens]|uniref:WD repeat-containing protein 75 second beta-propeller domain-containing protein n=1 Tax=Trichoplax adhaerens TaxID=10228 RepID=B3RQS0_TRIAD|nr:hypothetical protein TRIADDRAFT_55093 [Trichoplax adhaerens]EDV27287.1 hypothetical protein TRIADDRAFT_55093 [Trichoplax adhaerens]|eukprot:XP_002111283.1 hypothetical protein TRIADDRAFT_55093 [Trichoplax adhaerens]
MELQAIKHNRLLTKNPLLISKDSKYIFCYCRNIIQIFSSNTGQAIRTLVGHRNTITHCLLNPHNFLQLISCSLDGQVIYWDYDAGTQLKVFNADCPIWRVIPLPGDESAAIVIKSSKKSTSTKKDGLAHVIRAKLSLEDKKIAYVGNTLFSVKPNTKYCQLSPDGGYIASIAKKSLRIYDIKTGKLSKFTRRVRLTCLTIHPLEDCIATGDGQGKIILWRRYRIMNEEPIQLELHWHAHPVLDIQYNIDGSCLLSGGSEGVLVVWQLRTETKHFLPRLGSSIVHINSSSNYSIVAVSLKDNVIHLISPSEMAIKQSIQGLHKACELYQLSSPVPTGLVYDPRSRAIVLNSIPGSLQFYDIHSHKTTKVMDVVGQNYVVSHSNKSTSLTDVTHVAFHPSGNWLATVMNVISMIESRNNKDSVAEMKLKFWEFSEVTQSYTLNTTVEPPHSKFVTAIVFRPENDTSTITDPLPMLVTTDSGGYIKTWLLDLKCDSIRDDKPSWTCYSVSHYRDSPATTADFSHDSSLLGVAYDEIVTLWDPSKNEIQKTLSHLIKSENVRHMAFGRKSCSHLLTTTTNRLLYVWNLLSCTTLYVFSPDESKSIAVLRDFSNQQIISAMFVPVSQAHNIPSDSWLFNQRYYFITNSQDLYSLEPEDRQDDIHDESTTNTGISEESPFVRIFGEFEDTLPMNDRSQASDLTYRARYSKNVREVFIGASHVLPSMTTICAQFVKSSLEATAIADLPDGQENGNDYSDSESEIDSANSDEEIVIKPQNDERMHQLQPMEIDRNLDNTEMNFDWMDELVNKFQCN